MPHQPVAFRCKNCGHLEPAAHAGDHVVPHACSVCGAGVTHSPRAKAIAAELGDPECTVERRMALAKELGRLSADNDKKRFDSENWEVLADAPPERLAELELEPQHVAKHTGTLPPPTAGRNVAVHAVDSPKSKDVTG